MDVQRFKGAFICAALLLVKSKKISEYDSL